MNAPRASIASRAALNRELTIRVAACMEHIRNVDDLILQLTGPGAAEFIAGWQQNRLIVDAGGGPGEEEPPHAHPADALTRTLPAKARDEAQPCHIALSESRRFAGKYPVASGCGATHSLYGGKVKILSKAFTWCGDAAINKSAGGTRELSESKA